MNAARTEQFELAEIAPPVAAVFREFDGMYTPMTLVREFSPPIESYIEV